MALRAQARVQRCGKSAPAASRGAGLVNPGWVQGKGFRMASLPNAYLKAARGCWKHRPQIDDHPLTNDFG